MFLIHLFPALACNYTPGIRLVISKLVSSTSLASDDHDEEQATSNTTTMSDAVHVGRDASYVSKGLIDE